MVPTNPTATATATSLSLANQPPLSPQVGTQLIEAIAIPVGVVIFIAFVVFLSWSSIKKRVQKKKRAQSQLIFAHPAASQDPPDLPTIMTTPPSRESDKDVVAAAKLGSERRNGCMCKSGLTVPLPARNATGRARRPMPPTPRLKPIIRGSKIPALDIGPCASPPEASLGPLGNENTEVPSLNLGAFGLPSTARLLRPLDDANLEISPLDLGPPAVSEK